MSRVRRKSPIGTPAPLIEDVSDAQKEVFFRTLHNSFEPSIKEACVKAGISKPQYEKLVESDKDFVTKIREFREKQLDDMEDALFRSAANDANLAWKLLAANRPEKYGTKGKLDVTHKIESMEDLQNLTDEELAELQAKVCR